MRIPKLRSLLIPSGKAIELTKNVNTLDQPRPVTTFNPTGRQVKSLLKFLIVFYVLVCASSCCADKPNIVIFFIDDMGYKDLGCYGSDFYETPCIDRLAMQSARFTQFYSAHPVCSPTRAALMTGKAPQRLGITQWIHQPSEIHLPSEEETLGEAFQAAGYDTGYIGKWHLGEKDSQMPAQNGFNWTKGVNRAGQPAHYFHPFQGKERNGIAYWDVPDMEDSQPGDYLTDGLTDHAIDFISAKRDKPFLLCFGHYAVHTPIQSPKPLIEKYKKKKADLFSDTPTVEASEERNQARSRVRQDDAAYAAMVENLDTNIGRVLDKLDELGIRNNTIIVFSSDNGGLSTLRNKRGGPTSVKPLRAGKAWCYEGGIRVPTLVSWPNKIPVRELTTPGITMDIYPTLAELAEIDVKPDQTIDGVSLASALTGEPDAKINQRVLGWHYPHPHSSGHQPSSSLREGDWKILWRSEQDQYELYNLDNDISESKDVAAENPEKLNELRNKLQAWLESTTQPQSNN